MLSHRRGGARREKREEKPIQTLKTNNDCPSTQGPGPAVTRRLNRAATPAPAPLSAAALPPSYLLPLSRRSAPPTPQPPRAHWHAEDEHSPSWSILRWAARWQRLPWKHGKHGICRASRVAHLCPPAPACAACAERAAAVSAAAAWASRRERPTSWSTTPSALDSACAACRAPTPSHPPLPVNHRVRGGEDGGPPGEARGAGFVGVCLGGGGGENCRVGVGGSG